MIIIEREFRRSHLVQEEALSGMTFTGEDGGHKFIVHVKSPAGEAETLTGSVVGKFVRADGVTVELTAAEDYAGLENGAAWVVLAANCYTQAGPFRLTVTNIASDETRNTVCAFTGYVRTSETGEIVDPENVINVDAIVGMIDELQDAIEDAQEQATSSVQFTAQSLTDAQKGQARTNIGAGSEADVSDLKSAFTNRTAGVLNSYGNVDLDITDPDGNVIMRLADGGIQTKNFDSASINPTSADTEDDDSDLDVIDIYGNVLARFEDGGVQTKKFRGYDYKTYVSPTAVYNGSALTLTVPKTFSRGDRIVLHCERGAMPWDYGAAVSYYEGQTPIKTNWRADCAWLEYTVQGDGVQISAVYAANATGMSNGNVRFEVSLLGDLPVRPTVVTVKQDGSGDYTTLRGALDAIGTKANDVLNPYRIEIYPGTYDVMDDYTDEEIAAAEYTQTGFVGPKLLNGMSLVGMGLPHQVVISGTLDTTQWTSSIRQKISTLNFQGSVSMENLTVAAENLRYCIHDDFHSPMGKLRHVEMKNIVFKATGEMSYSIPVTYGASARESGAFLYAENCDFGFSFGMHTDSVAHNDSCMYLKNCKGIQGSFYDQITDSSYTGEITVFLDGCDFAQFSLGVATGVTPHTSLKGTLVNSPMYGILPTQLYDTSDVVHCKKLNLSQGTAVEKYVYTSDNQTLYWRKATQVDKVGGIIVFNDDDTTYVQHKGYVRTDRLGLSGMTLGDWIGIDSNGASQIVQSEADAWGRVAMMNAGGTLGYVKMKGV